MEELLRQLLKEVREIKSTQQEQGSKIDALQSNVSGVETQLSETNQIVQALMHRTEELDAKIEGLALTTASKDAADRIEAKLDVLAHRLFEQEADIQLLKKAR